MTVQTAVTVLRLDATQHNAAAGKAAEAIGRVGTTAQTTAKQTAQAMRSLPAQFTDVATQLAGGQNPLLILLQQGGQVRDQFGSIGAAVRGISSLITPTALGIGAFVALGGVLLAAERDASKLRDTLALTNNASGLTPGSLQDVARQVAANSETSVRGAKGIVLELAATGTVSRRVLDDVALAVARVAEVSGRSAGEVAKEFAKMGDGVAKFAADQNRQYNFLTAGIYRQIVALEAQGRTEEAVILVSRRLTEQMEGQRQQLGYAERAWNALGRAASGAWDAILNVGTPDTLSDRLNTAQERAAQVRRLRGGNDPLTQEAEQQVQLLKEQRKLQEQGARSQQEAATLNRREVAAEVERQAELKRQREQAARDAARLAELAFDRTPPLAGLDYQDRSDRLELAGRPGPDPLGEFINERVLPADQERNDRRLEQQNKFLQDLTDANAQANLALIADDQLRALAQVDLERQMQQRRIEAIFEAGPQRAEAERQADAAADAQRQGVGMRYAKSTALFTRDEFANALSAAFQGSQNPARAFAEALGNVVFQRLTARIGDALATAFVGADGTGGLLGGLFAGVVGAFGGGTSDVGFASVAGISGGRASGGGVNRGALYEINEHDSPGEVLNTRSGRSYLLAGQDGEIVPARRRGVGGGGGGGGFSGEVRIRLTNVQGQAAEVTNARMGTDGGLDIEAEVRRIVVNDIARGGEIDRIASRTWGVNRASGLPRRG